MVAALEPQGDTIAMNGSDTLYDVTQQVIANCPGIGTHGITYSGGGSGVGAGQMLAHTQRVSPMSRALKNSEYCVASGTAFNAGARPGLAEDLLVGLDGVALVSDQTTSCASTTANGFGRTTAFPVFADGLTGTPTSCPGCDASNNYTFADSFDALKVLYFGLTHDGTYDCNGSVRKSLVKNWANLFADTTCAGGSTCSTGLTHAFRRSDLSGTTDAFVSVFTLPAKPGLPAGGSVGIGTLSTVPVGASQKMNPFCNGSDNTAATPTISFGGSSDFQDKDPIRVLCGANGANDDVCQGNPATGSGNFRGDLGVVLPVLIPDTTTAAATDFYHSQNCSTACTLVAPIRANRIPAGFKCPDGTAPLAGFCYMPATASGDPRCHAAFSTKCVSSPGRPDGRLYNLINVVAASQVPTASRGTAPYQMALDVQGRILTGAFYRIHETSIAPHNVPDASVGTTGTCHENDDTSQIGCLVNADPCAVGYAGREAAKFYPGLGSPAIAQPAPLKAAAINGTPPFTPGLNPDLAITNLLQAPGTTPLYPIARRLYFATIYGFANAPTPDGLNGGLQGGEKLLADCYGNNSIVGPAISSHGYINIPGGVQCLDYPEELATTSTPPVNVQGPGSVALGGCNLGLAGQNACSVSPPTITP
jgi:hypothetical protein